MRGCGRRLRRRRGSCRRTKGWRCTRRRCAGRGAGPLLEIGTYCGKSTIYLAAAARERGTVGDHGGPPPRLGGAPGRLGVPRPGPGRPGGRPDRHAADDASHAARGRGGGRRGGRGRPLGHGRRAVDDAGRAGLHRRRPHRGGGPARLRGLGAATWSPGGLLVIHDVFPDPADGGQAPYHIYQARAPEWTVHGGRRRPARSGHCGRSAAPRHRSYPQGR